MQQPAIVNGTQLQGLIPALDPKQPGTPHIVAGRNFLLDAEGPYSAFGNILVTKEQIPLAERYGVQTFRIGTYDTVMLTTKAFYKYDRATQNYYPIYVLPSAPATDSKWYMAFVGGKYYFARQGYGLLEYTPATNTWATITTNVPTGLMACAEAGGRLILLGTAEVRRSAIDDGADLATSVSTGAGATLLSFIGGTPIHLSEVVDGFLVYTTKGIMKAELVDERVPFRVAKLAGPEYAPLSCYTICQLELNQDVWLSRTGLHTTDGRQLQNYQPLMSEYFVRKVLPFFDLSVPNTILFSYAPDKRMLFISLSEKEQRYQYTRAFVLYIPTGDKWGSFNRLHYGWGELALDEGTLKGYNYGYVCGQGYVHKLIDYPYQEQQPFRLSGVGDYEFVIEPFNFPTYTTGTVHVVSSNIHFTSYNPDLFTQPGYWRQEIANEYISEEVLPDTLDASGTASGEDYMLHSGITVDWLTDISGDEDWNTGELFITTPSQVLFQASMSDFNIFELQTEYISTDSSITVGPFRLQPQESVTQLWRMNYLALGMLAQPGVDEQEDWLTYASPDSITEDWNTISNADEDYGEDALANTDYSLSVWGSADGHKVYANNREAPYEYRTDVSEEQFTRFYTLGTIGIHQFIDISALENRQSFHLKYLEFDGRLEGNL